MCLFAGFIKLRIWSMENAILDSPLTLKGVGDRINLALLILPVKVMIVHYTKQLENMD